MGGLDGVTMDRRRFLAGTATVAGAVALGVASPAAAETDLDGPFRLGVASGDPLPDAVVLWTRLVRDPYDAGSMPARPIPVEWEVSADASFRYPVRRGVALARPEWAHSVHVDVRGLEPGREYAYRFRADRLVSPVGRTRTAPPPWADPVRLCVGVVNCQDWQNGYWPAYDGLAAEDLDVVLHLGDYIYEYDPRGRLPGRAHVPPERVGLDQLSTLADYRNRHAQYKSDPALQGAHAAFPWIVTWDDHETENNYADLVDEIDDRGEKRQTPEEFRVQRAHAYQAYWEHMPIRPPYRTASADYRIYRRFDFGRMARVNVLDTRQYRTDQPGGFPGDFGLEAAGTGNATGTLTGGEQELWLDRGLLGSAARWNVIAQQVMMSRVRFPNPALVPPTFSNLDQWDGYVPQRTRLLRFVEQARVRNPVVLGGDIHSCWFSDLKFSDLKRDFDDPASPTVAAEFVATSVSSDFPIAFDAPLKAVNPVLNPHVRFFDGSLRGYLRCELGRDSWRTDVRTVASIDTPVSPVATTASYAVESGRPGIVPA
ncbi:MAG TPA: alkaline phosphatase D family protein [Mycobacteriales bacterium]